MASDRFQPSKRSDVAPFIAMDVLSEAASLEAAGRSIIHMEVGNHLLRHQKRPLRLRMQR